jgi:glutamate synthase (ferredoxin)
VQATYKAVEEGNIILSDRGVSDMAPIPMLMACSYIHHSINLLQVRSKFELLLNQLNHVHHFVSLFDGVSAINPYLVNEIIRDQVDKGIITDLKVIMIANYNSYCKRDSENHE